MSEQLIPDTANDKVAAIAAALYIADRCTPVNAVDKNAEYMELLKKFAKAHEIINEVAVRQKLSSDQVNGFLDRIGEEIRGS